MTTIAITAATGQLGRLAVEKLKQKHPAHQIVAIVRNVEKAQNLAVTVRQGDYNDRLALVQALQGVDKLYLISSNELGKRAEQHQNVIDAAKTAGVTHIVYTSLLRADSSPLSLAKEHRLTEQALKQSGVTYTILRNGWYTENYTDTLAAAISNGALYGSAGDGKISSASREDFAEAAVAVLTGEGHENQTYELAGDTAYTLSELAAEASKQTGKTITYVDLTETDYAKALSEAGVPADFAQLIAGWDTSAKNGALFSDDKTLSRLIGRSTTALPDSVKAAL